MSKRYKIFWVIFSLILLILLLPILTLIGLSIIIGVYVQVVKDFINNEFKSDEDDAVGSPEYVAALPEDCEQNY